MYGYQWVKGNESRAVQPVFGRNYYSILGEILKCYYCMHKQMGHVTRLDGSATLSLSH